jgi:hypothetical protein
LLLFNTHTWTPPRTLGKVATYRHHVSSPHTREAMFGGLPTLRHLPYPERSRFVPQYDEEVRGTHQNLRIHKDYNNVPNHAIPGTLNTVSCGSCETTWLVGFAGVQSANHHPFHNTLYHEYSGQSRRSMVVQVIGTCPGDGAPSGRPFVGVFFGHGSSHNLNQIIRTPIHTRLAAEIVAATVAVRKVRETVRPRREETIRASFGAHLESCWRDGWGTTPLEYHRNNWIFRLIVYTDLTDLVECLCKHRRSWRLEPNSSVYRDSKYAPLPNGALFGELVQEIDLLSRDGVEVM